MGTTLGIDLSSQPKNTAICLVEWSPDRAEVVALWRGTDPDGTPLGDGLLIALMRGSSELRQPSKVAIDAPLGWPIDFVRGVGDPVNWPVTIDASRARLERRATDHWVHETTGKQPLSVTTDRIAYPAMRAAGLLAHYARTCDEPVDRSGLAGRVCETYPDPAIRRFGLWPPSARARDSYKGAANDVRKDIVDRLADAARWLILSSADRARCIEFDDCLDALVCALAARATEQGKTVAPPAELAEEAALEGWIHLPQPASLSALL
jgi:hypothetical protein